MREIKFRMWTGERYIYDANIVVDCLRQQTSGLYDHVNLHQSDFEQYTGLKDKNGKEIYEGDIISYWNGTLNMVMYETDIIYDNHYWIRTDKKVVPVIFEDGCFRLPRNNPLCSFLHGDEELEVIGNIHENPELLK